MGFKCEREAEETLRILAKTMFRSLQANGYSNKDVVSFTSELIHLVTSELRGGEGQAR